MPDAITVGTHPASPSPPSPNRHSGFKLHPQLCELLSLAGTAHARLWLAVTPWAATLLLRLMLGACMLGPESRATVSALGPCCSPARVPLHVRGSMARLPRDPILPSSPPAAVLVTTEEDIERVFGITGKDYEEAAARVADRFSLKVVAITLRENPLVWKNTWTAIAYQQGRVLRTRAYEVEIVDRLGAGDSFAAGLIHGLLDGDLQKALDYGGAASALKHSIPGDFAWITRAEVEALLKVPGLRISR